MPASIGVNLRVTGHCRQGGRKYMEDFFSVAYQQTEDERDLEYAFFGIFDGHGGAEAAAFAKEHLMESIVKLKSFWSDNDEDVLRAIKDGYLNTHYAMWKEQEKWPKTASGLPSTAGTTASVAFIRRGKIYIGHVGDSGIILGYQEPGCPDWKARPLTKDHKPENAVEISRIEQCGGKVIAKSGVPRVVWNRPRIGRQGPVLRSTQIDEIPFLAVARSLGDLWSYNSELDEFVVSPDPDCSVIPIDTSTFRCLIFGTDGLYNMLSPQTAVHIVQQAERHNENAALSDVVNKIWLNPSKCLVEKALERWSSTKMRADNTSVVTLILDPPGPPRAQVLKIKKKHNYPNSGLKIMTRYEYKDETSSSGLPSPSVSSSQLESDASASELVESNHEDNETSTYSFEAKPKESLGFDPNNELADNSTNSEVVEADSSSWNNSTKKLDENIQINEISSSSDDTETDSKPSSSCPNLRSSTKSAKERVEPEIKCKRLRNSTGKPEPVKKINTRSSVSASTSAPAKETKKKVASPAAQKNKTRECKEDASAKNKTAIVARTTRSSTKGVPEKELKSLKKLNVTSLSIRKAKNVTGKKLIKEKVSLMLKSKAVKLVQSKGQQKNTGPSGRLRKRINITRK